MEKLKQLLSSIPVAVWGVILLVALVMSFWFKDDIGNWWSNHKNAEFDKIQAQQQLVIDDLTKQKEAAIQRAVQAEAREQAKIIETDLLRQEVAKHGINIDAAQQKLADIGKKSTEDQNLLDQVKNGDVSKLQLCTKQCADSAELGYPCRANYCDKFK